MTSEAQSCESKGGTLHHVLERADVHEWKHAVAYVNVVSLTATT